MDDRPDRSAPTSSVAPPGPRDPRWGPQTALAVDNFRISGRSLDHRVVRALCRVKRHAAAVNAELAVPGCDGAVARAIADACGLIEGGGHADAFVVDTYQTGSGTSTNMNVNEVVAHLASVALGRTVHPNDHVNASQSSNDAVPSAIRIAVAEAIVGSLLPALDGLIERLRDAAARFGAVTKAGRTHLVDATPVFLGDEVLAWAHAFETARARVASEVVALGELPLGGTATGTGLNAPAGFATRVVQRLAHDTGLPLRAAATTARRMAHQGGQGALSDCSAALRAIAIALTKMANDVRLLASGPRTGLGELHVPALQAGSSMMPGKVNPVLCETANQVAARVFGNDATIAYAASQGILELNTYLPVMADALLESVTLLANTAFALADKLLPGLTADVDRCFAYAARSSALATALVPLVGYERATDVVRLAAAGDRTLRDVAVELALASPEAIDAALDVTAMARPS